jgi:glycosyltransferase involved in cell wall biosynthesis
MELVEALALLRPMYPSVHLHFVGWDEKPNRPIEKALIRRGEELDVLDRIVFHGAMKLGDDLWNMYRLADIYCIPSYHEGFPRTIWEAMANGIPVITTPVGGIPFYLSHEENAYFVNPKSVQALAAAIKLLIEDDVLRKRIISNAFSLVKNNTVSARANQLIVHIENSINNQ